MNRSRHVSLSGQSAMVGMDFTYFDEIDGAATLMRDEIGEAGQHLHLLTEA